MSLDVAIRGGTVVDGTGASPRVADVGIVGGRVVEIGPNLDARRELDATGLLVLPGFLDLHTHYDPQVLWDPELTPSSYQGVTSVVAGILLPAFPLSSLAFAGVVIATVLRMRQRTAHRSTAQVIWDLEAEGSLVPARPSPLIERF